MPSVHSKSNGQRKKNHNSTIETLERFFDDLVVCDLLRAYEKNYSESLPNFPQTILTADFLLTDFRGSKIICYTQKTIRERYKRDLLQAHHFKKCSKIKNEIIGQFLIYPNSLEEDDEFKRLKKRCEESQKRKNPPIDITATYTCDQFREYLEELKNKLSDQDAEEEEEESFEETPAESRTFERKTFMDLDTLDFNDESNRMGTTLVNALCTESVPPSKPNVVTPGSSMLGDLIFHQNQTNATGKNLSNRGHHAEECLTEYLNDSSVLQNLKNGTELVNGHPVFSALLKELIEKILHIAGIPLSEVVSIDASKDIPLLNEGGYRKTDVHITVTSTKGEQKHVNISCKYSKNSSVSCHESDVEKLINHLYPNKAAKPKETALVEVLRTFQQQGNWSWYQLPEPPTLESGLNELEYRIKDVARLALKGEDDAAQGKKTKYDGVQIIFMHHAEKCCYGIFEMDDYITRIIQDKDAAKANAKSERDVKKLRTGTPFSWTYPSKQRGRKIQLKTKMKFNSDDQQ